MLSREQIQAVWESIVDEAYAESLKAAGEGDGFEVWTQAFEQLRRAAQAVDVTTQALYILPSVAQTNPSAGGAQLATVSIAFARTGYNTIPLLLPAGSFAVYERQIDAGPEGGEEFLSGRNYLVGENVYLAPGEQGPISVVAVSERPGHGMNNPLPGTLSAFVQPGSGFYNERATLRTTVSAAALTGTPTVTLLTAENVPDMFVPEHVGQYVLFLGGANAGTVARIVAFSPPVSPEGSSVQLENIFVMRLTAAIDFTVGETVRLWTGMSTSDDGYARVVDSAGDRLTVTLLTGDPADVLGSDSVEGTQSGATATIDGHDYASSFVDEEPIAGVGGAMWRILDWVTDFGLVATNAESPTNGRSGWLDDIGAERNVNRAADENDVSYAKRVATPAEVVTPNAIKRVLNRTLGALPWCFREVGTSKFRGLFADGTAEPASVTPGRARNDAFDYGALTLIVGSGSGSFRADESIVVEETTTGRIVVEGWFGRSVTFNTATWGQALLSLVRRRGAMPGPPENPANYRVRGVSSNVMRTIVDVVPNNVDRRWRLGLEYQDFRAFFAVGLPIVTSGDFGLAYDSGPRSAYDSAPFIAFYDGFPAASKAARVAAAQAVNRARAGGVGVHFYPYDGCVDDNPTGVSLLDYDPSEVSGLLGWWEGYEGLESTGGLVTAWRDLSGNGWDWEQATPGDRPELIVGQRQPGVRFDATKFLESVRRTFATGVTVLVMTKPSLPIPTGSPTFTTPNLRATLFGDSDVGAIAGFGFASGNLAYKSNGVQLSGSLTIPVGDRIRLAGYADSNAEASQLFVDGLLAEVSGMAWNSLGIDRLGVGFGDVDGFSGEVYAAAIFDRVLTPLEIYLLTLRWQTLYL